MAIRRMSDDAQVGFLSFTTGSGTFHKGRALELKYEEYLGQKCA
jgi:hypothetical protein